MGIRLSTDRNLIDGPIRTLRNKFRVCYQMIRHSKIIRMYVYIHIYKLKVKFALEQAMKAQRGSRDIALFFL